MNHSLYLYVKAKYLSMIVPICDYLIIMTPLNAPVHQYEDISPLALTP